MRKLIKKGIRMIGTGVCTLVSTLMLYGQPKDEIKIEPYSLEKEAEVYADYKNLINTIKKGGFLSCHTLQQIDDYLGEHLPHMSRIKSGNTKELIDFVAEKECAKYLSFEKDSEGEKEFERIKITLEEKVLKYFPGLAKEKSGIIYEANQQIEEEQSNILKQLINDFDKVLRQKSNENLSILTKKEKLSIKDLLIFYNVLSEKKQIFNLKSIEKKEGDVSFVNILEHKKAYESFLESVEKWKKTKSQSRYISQGLISLEEYRSSSPINMKGELEKGDISQPTGVSELELRSILNCDIENAAVAFPQEAIFPRWWGLLLSLFAPVASKLLVTLYTRRKKWDTGDGGEIITAILFGPITDGLHPLAFPIRILAVPILTEYLGKKIRRENKKRKENRYASY